MDSMRVFPTERAESDNDVPPVSATFHMGRATHFWNAVDVPWPDLYESVKRSRLQCTRSDRR